MPSPEMLQAEMPQAYVIGHPVAHSRSPLLHGYWLKRLGLAGRYDKRDVAPQALPAFFDGMRAGQAAGCNVTVPHKEAALALVDEATPAARAIGAVNTVWREGDRLIGDNSDAYGFLANLDDRAPGWERRCKRAIVLGAGGATRAVLYALLSRRLSVALHNRTLERAQKLADEFGPRVSVLATADLATGLSACDLLVNATALGMAGKPELDIDLAGLPPAALVHDIVYVPLKTRLLYIAEARGNPVVDGLGMLIHQAVPGFERWFGVRPVPDEAQRRLLEDDIAAALAG